MVQDLKEGLQQAKARVADATGLYESDWWDFLHHQITGELEKRSKSMTLETEPSRIYRAQGGYTALMDVINEIIDLKDGKVKGEITLDELEEEYERRSQELDDIS